MDMNEYIKNAKSTESIVGPMMIGDKAVDPRILHAAIGLSTEAGEMIDALKKHMFYGAELDKVNMREEAGDILWYMAILIDALETSFEEVAEVNIKKLSARYPEKFSKEQALNRNLDKERQILEGGE